MSGLNLTIELQESASGEWTAEVLDDDRTTSERRRFVNARTITANSLTTLLRRVRQEVQDERDRRARN